MNLKLVGTFLQIGLGALGLINPLAEEWASGDHIGVVNNSIQGAAVLATAATSDAATQTQINQAAALAQNLMPQFVTAVNEIKAFIASLKS